VAEIAADLDPISRVAVHQGPLSLSRETGKEPMKKTQPFSPWRPFLKRTVFLFPPLTHGRRVDRNRDQVLASFGTVSVPLVYA